MEANNWLEVEAPDVNDRELAGYWEGVSKRQLLVQKCASCDTYRWPPRGVCGVCHSLETSWTPAGSSGRLFTWTVVWHTNLAVFKDHTPYAVGVIQLDNAPIRMIGHLDMAPDALTIDMPVEVTFRELRDGVLLPVWVGAERS